jgi:CDP-glucose 4,6-dehydratase
MPVNAEFWRGKNVLITGHTGFKGGWLTLWLLGMGAEVSGIALPAPIGASLFEAASVAEGIDSHFIDIRDASALCRAVRKRDPEIVFHLAAQPLVRAGYRDPLATFATNVMGTANLLDALRGRSAAKVVVVVTTDKVYHNEEWHYPYRETDRLGGRDPYSASKAAAELVTEGYRGAFLAEQGLAVASARAGNVIGGGDWAEDRLIPDAVRAWSAKMPIEIRRPEAVRPWQHVMEPLAGYLALCEHIWRQPELAGAYNFGPEANASATVRTVIETARRVWGDGEVLWGNGSGGPHEAGLLALETSKTNAILKLKQRWALSHSVERSLNWYKAALRGEKARELCERDIAAYIA